MFTRQLVLLCAGGLLVPPIAESASPAPIHVTARLYNIARVPASVKTSALDVTAGALNAGGIHLQWLDCDVAESCAVVPARGELIIRLVRSGNHIAAGTHPNVGVALSGPRKPPLVLGEAFIDVRERTGVLASVFVDRVELIAAMSEIDAASLLGLAIAHELGHLLLGTTSHSVSGLMRAEWSPDDIRRRVSSDWELNRRDAAAIRKRLR
jgi:hypothetical protein